MSRWVEVGKPEFYAWVMSDKRNLHPRPQRMETEWVCQKTHKVLARSTPGYLLEGEPSYRLISHAQEPNA